MYCADGWTAVLMRRDGNASVQRWGPSAPPRVYFEREEEPEILKGLELRGAFPCITAGPGVRYLLRRVSQREGWAIYLESRQ